MIANCQTCHWNYDLNNMDEVAEWLRRWTANPMCSAREGSNPFLVGILKTNLMIEFCNNYPPVVGVKIILPIPGIEPGPSGWEPDILTTRPYRIAVLMSISGASKGKQIFTDTQVTSCMTQQSLPPWRNWLARSAVNRKVGGSSPPGGAFLLKCLQYCTSQKAFFILQP